MAGLTGSRSGSNAHESPSEEASVAASKMPLEPSRSARWLSSLRASSGLASGVQEDVAASKTPSETWRSARWLASLRASSGLASGLKEDVPGGPEEHLASRLFRPRSRLASVSCDEKSMPRVPVPWGGVPAALRAIDWVCTFVFAVEGAITAASSGMDLLGVIIVGIVTAVGGGTVRDFALLHRRPCWVDEVEYIVFSVIAAVLVFFTWPLLPAGNVIKADSGSPGALLWWLDSLGLGLFAVTGAQAGMRASITPALSIASGMLTATFGGVIRDVLCSLPVRILHSHAEIYAVAALTGAALYVLSRRVGLRYGFATVFAIAATVLLRCLAVRYSLALPEWGHPSWHVDPLRSSDTGRVLRGVR